MKKYLLGVLLIIISSNATAESCLFEPTPKQPWDDIFCIENVGVSKKAFAQLCDLLTLSRTVKQVSTCPAHVVAKCNVDLSYTDGSIIQYIYSKKDFTDQLKNHHKSQCENHTLGKGKWVQ